MPGSTSRRSCKAELVALGHDVDDLGTDQAGVSVDYPDFGAAVARAVAEGRADLGVCACGTGNGISMAANKVPGSRAAVVHDVSTAALARRHNHANVVCLGARTTGPTVAVDALLRVPGGVPRSTAATTGASPSWRRLDREPVRPDRSTKGPHEPLRDRAGRPIPRWPTLLAAGAGPPVDHPAADRLGELHLAGRAGRLGLGADQQVRRGLSGPALLRRQPGHRRGRGPGPGPGHGAVRGRARQRAAARRRQRQPGRLPGPARARRHRSWPCASTTAGT